MKKQLPVYSYLLYISPHAKRTDGICRREENKTSRTCRKWLWL